MSHKSSVVRSVELTRLQTWVQALALTHTGCMSNHGYLGCSTRFCTTVWMGMMLVSVLQGAMRLEETTLSLCQLHANTNQHTSLNTPPSDRRLWTRDSEPGQSQSLIPLPTAIGPGKGTWPNLSQSECLPGIFFFWPGQPGSSSFLFDPQTVGRSAWRCLQSYSETRHGGREKRLEDVQFRSPPGSKHPCPGSGSAT